jgi:tetratricopeptide (TPR) repeat protein
VPEGGHDNPFKVVGDGMNLEELRKLDVTNSMSATAKAINDAIGMLSGDCHLSQDKEILGVINKKLLEVDQAFDRPLDSPETFVKLRDIAKKAGQSDLEGYCQEQVNMLEANDLHFRGYTWLFYGDCVRASEYLKKAANLAPKHPVASVDLGKAEKRLAKALVTMGKLEESLQYFDQALAKDPQSADAMAKKGAALEGLGRYSEAVALFNKALDIKPTSQIAKKGLNLAEYFEDNPDIRI